MSSLNYDNDDDDDDDDDYDDDDDDESVQCCKKNPGHATFLALDQCLNQEKKFMQRLPSIYHGDTELLTELIQSLADLTVKLVSGQYMGTGFILKVTLSFNDGTVREPCCTCKQCTSLDKPKSVVGKIYVRTAGHVIVNEKNDSLRSTVCILYYNSKESDAVDVVAARVKTRNDNDTLCLVCSTCQLEVLEKIRQTLDKFRDIKSTVNNKYNMRRNPEDLAVIMVSHPHGMHKRVTIGPYFPTEEASVTKYKADTCCGSSGAYVFTLGGSDDTEAIVHIGSNKNGEEKFSFGNFYREQNTMKSETFFQHIIGCCRRFVKDLFHRYDSNK